VISEFSRQVAVDFQSDADFHERWSCPVHSMPPATADGRTGAVAASCVFWIEGTRGVFTTKAEDHGNCSVGSLTHGFKTMQEVAGNADVAALCESGWVTPEAVGKHRGDAGKAGQRGLWTAAGHAGRGVEISADRFGDLHEHDRHDPSRLQQRPRGDTGNSQDDIGREGNQFRSVAANALGAARTPADVNADVATLGPAQLRQSLCERQEAGLPCRIVRRITHEHADAPYSLGLLRTRRKRPRNRCAAEQRDEVAAPQLFESHQMPRARSAWQDIELALNNACSGSR
jgi:hypothetical protein